MSIPDQVVSNLKSIECLTMAQLLTTILADQMIDERRRGELASALRGLGKGLHQPLDQVPSDPALLRPLLANHTPAMAGFSAGRWRNIRSLTQAALAHVGKITIQGRARDGVSPAWKALLERLDAPGDIYRLGRFARYCTHAGIEPDAVSDQVLDNFHVDLEAHSLDADPKRTQREVARAWNRLGETKPGWPAARLAVPDNRNGYALPWNRFPASLKADVEGWLDHLAGRDPMAEIDFRPLRPTSIELRRKQVHLLASAMVLQGEDPASLHTLADIVVPARVAKGLRFLWDRTGGKSVRHAGQVAGTARSIARHWVKVDQDTLTELTRIIRKLASRDQETGMTERNRSRLRPFNDPAVLDRLLALPRTIRNEVLRRGEPTVALARQLQTAVAIDILTVIPIRMKNLRALKLGTHLLRHDNGAMTLALPSEEMKNRNVYEVQVPPETVKLIDLYVDRYHPLLARDGSDFLFPGQDANCAKSAEGVRSQIKRCLRLRCGVEMHPHLFRHLAAKMQLEHDPGAYGQVQRILGHTNLNTTMKFYSGMEQAAASASFGAMIEGKRRSADSGAVGSASARSRRGGGR